MSGDSARKEANLDLEVFSDLPNFSAVDLGGCDFMTDLIVFRWHQISHRSASATAEVESAENGGRIATRD
ncbi:hypothetical protein L596_001804 [Steinernema carpocapsae]|uniref:Uncharacterized protein n=1 Tax=Steinernema carpocapsae TaxID=34508 RepID=A0A4U8UMA8_STECR|nr:hypothetical protein L596_001804 [Steinernema carpocapsae]